MSQSKRSKNLLASLSNGNKKKLPTTKSSKGSSINLNDKGITQCLQKLRSCAVRLERVRLTNTSNDKPKLKKPSTRVTHGKKKSGEPVSTSGKLKVSLTSLKRLRPCAVRLERLAHTKPKESDSNDDLMKRYKLRPCSVVLNKLHTPQDLGLECEVILEPIKYAEIMITRLPGSLREVYYTVENGSGNSTSFEEYRLETFKALPKPNKKTDNSLKPDSYFLKRLPLELSNVFKVNGIAEPLPSILSVLSGEKISSLVLDAYLALLLAKSQHEMQPKQSRVRSSDLSKYKNFKLLSALYFPCFKINDVVQCPEIPYQECKPKFDLEPDMILIAPQFTCQHFYLAIFDFPSQLIHIMDSSWNYVKSEVRVLQVQSVLKHLLQSNPHLDQNWEQWYVNPLEKCAQQTDEYNCGCYVFRFVENLLNGSPTHEASLRKLSKMEILEMRRNVVRELLSTTNIGRQILEVLSE